MASVLEDLPRGSRIAILRLRSLGDCVLSTPAIDLLKRARPDVRIAVVVEDRFRAVFENNPDIELILSPELGRLRSWGPYLCLNLHGGRRSAWMMALSGARWRAGYGHYRHQFVYNLRIPRAQEILGVERTVHTAEHAASAMFWLGVPMSEIPRAKLVGALTDDKRRSSVLLVIHPFAAKPGKTWNGFHELANHFTDPVFIGGAGDDFSAFGGFRTLRGAPLDEVKQLLSGASLFIGNDSGPAHMAAAFGVPSVVMFGESNPAIWGPWKTPSEVLPITAEPAEVLQAVARLGVHA